MNEQQATKGLFNKLGGYYLIPHELLHVLAYRLIGKPCHYRRGDHRVRPIAPESETRLETLFVLLLPFICFFGLGLVCHFLWIMSAIFIDISPERYFIDGPTWHFIFPNLGAALMLYSGTARGDLIIAYRLLFGKDETQEQRPDPHRGPVNQDNQRHKP